MIRFQQVKPIPIFSRPIKRESQIWNKEILFAKGKKYWIKAPSGEGKSTLLHIIMGLRKDYEGAFTIDGKTSSSFSNEQWAEIRSNQISIVFQNLRLLPELTALQNIELVRKQSGTVDESKIKEWSKRLGVYKVWEQKASTLSYGQQQRVAIIRALARPFDFLLLDEPFSHLDRENIKEACGLIQEELTRKQAGLILVSHDTPYDFTIDESLSL